MLAKATYIPKYLQKNIDNEYNKIQKKNRILYESISQLHFKYRNDESLEQEVLTICDIKANALYFILKYITKSGRLTNAKKDEAILTWNEQFLAINKKLTKISFSRTSESPNELFSHTQLEKLIDGPIVNLFSKMMGIDNSHKRIVFKANTPLNELWDGALAPAIAELQGKIISAPAIDITPILLEADKHRTNTEVLDFTLLTDSQLGHWDLYWPDDVNADKWYTKTILAEPLYARNPAKDIQHKIPVAIDFGTTSTVVALKERGTARLLRIGMRDWRTLDNKDYENPTALEILNFAEFMKSWHKLPYKPLTQWKHIKCSHAAKEDMAQSATCSVLQSGITGLKTWAHTGLKDVLRRRDQQKKDFLIEALPYEEINDIKEGDIHPNIANFSTRNFDPIEVYAWFLGLAVNNQLQGGGRIYHEYYLSFPVKFSKETRERILYSFTRGLERCLPPSLGLSSQWRETSPLCVTEGASEPVAYAASALPALGLEPTADGLAFGVFDFGGGTTDFAVGLYRISTAKEEHEQGWYQVLELLDSSGDAYLGGEHLLQHMAYMLIEDNITKLLKTGKGIPFTMPIDAKLFVGAEALMDNSLVAQTNTNKLCEVLRPIWEGQGLDSEIEATGQIEITLFDKNNEEMPLVPLNINVSKLEDYLKSRILRGVEDFFRTFRQAFKRHNKKTESFHILLAGNSCRSPYVQESFEVLFKRVLKDKYIPNEIITIHNPLEQQDKNKLFGLKTGVALGILETAPGEYTGIIQREIMQSGETTFRFNVGRFKRDILEPTLNRFSTYQEWYQLGIVREDSTLILGYSTSALALEEALPRHECLEKRLTFDAIYKGKTMMIRALNPTSLEIGIEDNEDIIVITEINLEG